MNHSFLALHLQPYKRENKRTRARDAARAASPLSPAAAAEASPHPAAQTASSAASDDEFEDFTFAEPADAARWDSDAAMDDFSFAEPATAPNPNAMPSAATQAVGLDGPCNGAASGTGAAAAPSPEQPEEAGGGMAQGAPPAEPGERLPEAGDVVEYPLSAVVRNQLQEERTAGLALLVGRNIDRGDASTLQTCMFKGS